MTPRATSALVISADDWNRAMLTFVIVPIYKGTAQVAVFQIQIDADHYADASLVQSLDADDLGRELGIAASADLNRIGQAVADFLDLDALDRHEIRRPPARQKPGFWPHQRAIHWIDLGLSERKRVGVLTPDEHNAIAGYSASLYVTSRDKAWHRAWQVPCKGGWVITGDIIVRSHTALAGKRRPSPSELTRSEMGEVAERVRGTFGLVATGRPMGVPVA